MFPRLPPATRGLILANVGVFLLQLLAWNPMLGLFALWPTSSGMFHSWQLITYAFLHGSLAHIFLNMFALFMFGRGLELYWGGRRFLIYYFVCVLSAAVMQLPIPVPAWLFVTIYAAIELFSGLTRTQQGVAHFAHLGGMLGGALVILYWRATRQFSS